MNKKAIAGLALGLSLIANLASAEIDPQYLQNVLKDNNGWPLATVCIGSDVNVRNDATTNCEVITMLQKGDIFYVQEVIPRADYNWCKGVTGKGETGFMVSKYLEQAPRAAVPSERFRAAFNSSRIYDGRLLAQAMGFDFIYRPELVEKLKEETFGYAPHRYKVAYNWIHGEKNGDGGFDTIGVVLGDSGYDRNYNVAGLEVGQKFDVETIKAFNKNMNLIGWDSPDEIKADMGECYWYLYDTVDGNPRPVEGFGFQTKNGYISEIRYFHIPVD